MSPHFRFLHLLLVCVILLGSAAGCSSRSTSIRPGEAGLAPLPTWPGADLPIVSIGEDHLGNLRQLTTGESARDVVWSADGATLLYTSRHSPDSTERIFAVQSVGGVETMRAPQLLSSGRALTADPGRDGLSDDGERIVYASRPNEPVRVTSMPARRHDSNSGALELRIARADGRDDRAITANGATNLAPAFFPGRSDRIIFSSNLADPQGRNFDLWAVNADGTGLERLTYHPAFDGFASLSPDGRRLAFSSGRHALRVGERNVFVADWMP